MQFIESEPLVLFVIRITFELKVDQTECVLAYDKVRKEDDEEVAGLSICFLGSRVDNEEDHESQIPEVVQLACSVDEEDR